MTKWLTIHTIHTLRNQIMIGFLVVMFIVLAVNSVITYHSSSRLLTDNSERHMMLTANQANGRMEALIEQVNTLTLQIVTDPLIQKLFLDEVNGTTASFKKRQGLGGIISTAQVFSTDIHAVELYTTTYKRIYPLDDRRLDQRLKKQWIYTADSNKGRIAWLGIDPDDPDSVLAIRRIPLIDRWFSNGGYLVVKVHRDYFRFQAPYFLEQNEGLMMLLDQDNQVISSNLPQTSIQGIRMGESDKYVKIDDTEYMVVTQRSSVTGWTLIMLAPNQTITRGISILRNAVFVSGAIGCLLFLVMSWFLSTRITRPIRHLISTMRSIRLGALKLNPKRYSNREMNELNHTYNQMVEEIDQLIKLVYEKEIMQGRIELKALQAQINPHFLFNTLEAFYWSLEEKNEEELAHLVIAMSDLFRYTISQPQKDEWVTIRDELDHVERYLAIIKMRLGDRISWQIQSDSLAEQAIIPKLFIQPIVENAVQHGLENKIGSGQIVIRVLPDPQLPLVHIYIEDDGIGMDSATLQAIQQLLNTGRLPSGKGSGFAIANIHRRLQLLYSHSNASTDFYIDSTPGKGTTVHFSIPMTIGGEDHDL
jgi:two-component system sensor histidine kinase YesM